MISACLIVKDEEALLAGCLESIAGFADEIIVVDTGSTDKTMEIAKSFNKVRLFEQKWEGDFAKARNYSIDQATGDWIFIIDADERLHKDDVKPLAKVVKETEAGIISLAIWNLYKTAKPTLLTSVRLFRSELSLRYTGIVHNQLVIDKTIIEKKTSLRIEHLGYDLSQDKMKTKFERTRDLLEQQLDKDPNDAFALMNLAQLYRVKDNRVNMGCAEPIIEACRKAADITDPRRGPRYHVHLQATDMLAWTLFYTGKVDEALFHASHVIKLKEDFLDTIFLLGFCHYEKRLYEKAIFWFNRYMEVHETYDPATQYDNIIFMHIERHAECYTWIGKAAWHLGQNDKAVNCFISALKAKPSMNEAYEMLEVMYSQGLINDNEMNLGKETAKRNAEMKESFYNEVFSSPYDTKRYENIYSAISALLFKSRAKVLEIGCGVGAFGKKLIDLGINYSGFDFSEQAIKVASKEVGDRVRRGNAYDAKQYRGSYDTIVATEVFEHVEDLKVIGIIPEGKRIIMSLPNFILTEHMRAYKSARAIKERFEHLIDINTIQEFNNGAGKIFLVDGKRKAPITKRSMYGTAHTRGMERQAG